MRRRGRFVGLDMLTKCLPKEKLKACRQRTGLIEPMT